MLDHWIVYNVQYDGKSKVEAYIARSHVVKFYFNPRHRVINLWITDYTESITITKDMGSLGVFEQLTGIKLSEGVE